MGVRESAVKRKGMAMLLVFVVVLFAGLASMFFLVLRGQERMCKALREDHDRLLERLNRLERLERLERPARAERASARSGEADLAAVSGQQPETASPNKLDISVSTGPREESSGRPNLPSPPPQAENHAARRGELPVHKEHPSLQNVTLDLAEARRPHDSPREGGMPELKL